MPKPKDVLTGVDFDARDREIGIGENKEDEENNVGEEEDDEEWRFAIVLDGHDSEVKSVAWSAGGNLLATCSRDKSVWVWEEVGEDDFETVAVMQDHEGDVKCVAWHPEEELLASASYDDEVRLWREDVDDWGCCAVLRGHGGTVWGVVWEGGELGAFARGVGVGVGEREEREEWVKRRELAGPRLASCSDDGSVRIWRRCPRERVLQSRLSIIKSGSAEEEWVQEAQLPRVHKRPVYAIAWGRKGRVVSTGGDGAVVVYEERWRRGDGGVGSMTTESKATEASGDGVDGAGINGEGGEDGVESMEGGMKESASSERVIGQDQKEMEEVREATEWVVVAQIEAAHGAFEVNHVAWATRRDKKAGRGGDGELEEVIVTTGDDGAVKVWCLE